MQGAVQGDVAQNWLATLALLAWPVVALWLYKTRPVNEATIWTILGGYLLLPVGAGIKIAEGIPQLDKISIPALAALAGCFIFARRHLRFWNGFGLTEVLLLIFLIGPFVTSELNTDPVLSGPVLLPGVGSYDGLSAIVSQLLFVLPFFLGRQLLKSTADLEEILRTLVVAGLLYSLPILFEIRMSPQLHLWFYGYSPSQFLQQMRNGGFRPVVFIGHGLGVAFFTMTAILAATALWRTRTRVQRFSPARVTAYLSVILILCKGMASLVYGAAMASLILWTKPRLQLRVAMILVTVALLYPALRATDLVPTNYIVAAAKTMSEERADSLEFRFDHEQQMMDRATQRIWFGWGRFGRSRIFDEWGSDVSVTDGRWTITLGQFGLFGFAAEFGLLALAVFRAASAFRLVQSERDGIFLAAIALVVAITMVDMLPDAALTPLTWLFAGAMLGRAEDLRRAARLWRPSDRPDSVPRVTENAALHAHSVGTLGLL
jgi:hypothetical protein